MAKYFKITNAKELHHGFQYKTGLNILKEKFNPDKYESCGPGGFYFCDEENIPYFYCFGIYLREVHLPENDPKFKMIKAPGDKFRSNMIILGNKYPLYDLKTYSKFGLNILQNRHLIDIASREGHLHILDWWKTTGLPLTYYSSAIDDASANGQINALEWWKNSGMQLKYSIDAIDKASANGHIDVLEWWKNSGLRLKYSHNTIELPTLYKRHDVVDWWRKSGLKVREHWMDNEKDEDV